MTKAFLIDLEKCTGCYACQIACKDEHCGNTWLPYAAEQPETGQFWMKVNERERGQRPFVKVAYTPVLCMHCENAPCIEAAKDGAVYRREDGLIIVDPEKAKGQKQLVEACPYHAIYWNDELDLPQKCTGCAHLLDSGELDKPRCVGNCTIGALQFDDVENLDLDGTEVLHPEYGTAPRVYYKNMPKTFIAGTVYDPAEEEIIEGATVTAKSADASYTQTTNDFGDFWFDEIPAAEYTVTIEADGKKKELAVSTLEEDKGLGDIALA
jgi:Fe-S-cluster-containing dehydrogenase component